MGIGFLYARQTGRMLKIPQEKGPPKAMTLGPQEILEVKRAGAEAWRELVKTWGVEMPAWAAWLLSVAVVSGSAIMLDYMAGMGAALQSMPNEQRAAVEAQLRAQGLDPEVLNQAAKANGVAKPPGPVPIALVPDPPPPAPQAPTV